MPKSLHKSRSDKIIAGVCGGIGEYFKVDPTIVRLVCALAVFPGGFGVILYILAMIIMPDDPRYAQKEYFDEGTGASSMEEEAEGVAQEAADGAATQGAADKKKEGVPPQAKKGSSDDKKNQIFGLILVALGVYFLLERYFPLFRIANWWPVLLIIIGAMILFKGRGGVR